jgi:hypothetical protein
MSWFRKRNNEQTTPRSLPLPSQPTGEPLSIDVTAAGISIGDTALTSLTVSAISALLGEPRVVPPKDLALDDFGLAPSTVVIWDDSGLRAFTKGDDDVTQLSIRLAEDPQWYQSTPPSVRNFHPTKVFAGNFTVGGRGPLDSIPESELRKAYLFLQTASGKFRCTFSLSATDCGELRSMEHPERLAKSHTDELARIVRAAANPFREVAVEITAAE